MLFNFIVIGVRYSSAPTTVHGVRIRRLYLPTVQSYGGVPGPTFFIGLDPDVREILVFEYQYLQSLAISFLTLLLLIEDPNITNYIRHIYFHQFIHPFYSFTIHRSTDFCFSWYTHLRLTIPYIIANRK